MIEDLNRKITSCNTPLIREDARARGWINKPLIENYRDYIAFHDINYPEMVKKQLISTSKHCKTIKP